MRYPLDNWKSVKRGYTFGVKTFYSSFHLGVDYIIPTGTNLYAWDNIDVVKSFTGKEGGNTAWVKYDGKLFRFLHLKELPKTGPYKEGEVFAITNNTGVSTGAHVHIDISKSGTLEITNYSNFIDPDNYFKNLMTTNYTCNNPDILRACKEMGLDTGDNINDGEAREVLKKVEEILSIKDQCIKTVGDIRIDIDSLKEKNGVLEKTVEDLIEQAKTDKDSWAKEREQLINATIGKLTIKQLIRAIINKLKI